MILADKIINERKKNGWSQEELAEQMDVSRQSISKWESAQAVPDIQKIIKMAELFGVSTDYLLKDEIEAAETEIAVQDTNYYEGRKVSMEEANSFLHMVDKVTPVNAVAVALCILSPVLLIVLSGMTQIQGFLLTEAMAAAIGVITLLVLVAIAVFLFIVTGAKMKPFEYLEKEKLDTLYGVSGMVAERKKSYEQKHTLFTAAGVVLCVISPIPLICSTFMETKDYIVTSMVGILLILIAIGVSLMVRVGGVWEAYEKLLEEGDYTVSKKKTAPLKRKISSLYWVLTTVIFLAWSLVTGRWGISWIVWPIAGALFALVMIVVNIAVEKDE